MGKLTPDPDRPAIGRWSSFGRTWHVPVETYSDGKEYGLLCGRIALPRPGAIRYCHRCQTALHQVAEHPPTPTPHDTDAVTRGCRAAFALVTAAAWDCHHPTPSTAQAVGAAIADLRDLPPNELVDAAAYGAYLAGGILAEHLDPEARAAWLNDAGQRLQTPPHSPQDAARDAHPANPDTDDPPT